MGSPIAALGAIGTFCLALSVAEAARPQQPRFETATDVVRVYATVQDRNGHLVTDLQRDDFEIRDGGSVVPLTVFSRDPEPLTVAIMADLSGALFDRRTYDALHEALDAFADRLGPEDRVSVGWFSGDDVVPGRDLLHNTGSLKAAIRTEITISRANPQFSPAQIVLMTAPTRRPLWNAIAMAMSSIQGETGRKVALILTNGPNTTNLRGLPALREIRAMLPKNELMIYGVYGFEPRHAEGLVRQDSQAYEYPLPRLVEETGGGFVDVSTQRPNARMPLSRGVVAVMAGVADELRHQYALGFEPTKRDGKIRKIQVKSKRPNTKVWARTAYTAPAQ